MPLRSLAQNVIFSADFESASGDNNWTYQNSASDGNWLRGIPSPYYTSGFLMERAPFEGAYDLLTGQNFSQDVDGGSTRAFSQDILLPDGSIIIDFEYYFAYNTIASSADHFYFDVRSALDNSLLVRLVQEFGSSAGKPASWTHVNADLSAFAGQEVYLRVQARDGSNGSKIEAAVDLISITASNNTSIEGTVFDDLDVDGDFDFTESGISGVTVSLYQNDIQTDQTTTSASGYYSFDNLTSTDPYQLVFSGWPPTYSESVLGPENQGAIRNVEVGQEFVNFGLYSTSAVCSENPYLLIPCYVEGPYNSSISNDAAIIKLRASADGHDFLGVNYTPQYEGEPIVPYGLVGTVYGIAWQKDHKVYYASAFHKRYTSFGPGGPDAIYQLDLNGNLLGTLKLDNLLTATNSAGSDVHDLSTNGSGDMFDIGAGNSSFDGVGKRAFGDIEISDDNKILYAVNLFDKKIYALDVSTGIASNASIVQSWTAPDPSNASRNRPFGLAWHDGKLWLGSVDENGLTGWVHSLDVVTGTFTLELTIPLNYNREAFFGSATNSSAPGNWNAWQSDPSMAYFNVSNEIAFPQPIISDIEFATNGDMIIGFRDRFGDQSGAAKYFRPTDTNRTWAIAQGDILKACLLGNNYTLETGANGACPAVGSTRSASGPNGQEFYYWDIYELEQNTWDPANNTGAFHWETTQGGLVQLDNAASVITTALDPIDDFSGGIIKLNNTTGAREGIVAPVTTDNIVGGYTIFEGGDFEGQLPPANGFASKANGLGDLESACFLPITIGNLVWYDVNANGLQDESEKGLANVTVELYENGIKIGERITDDDGLYYFGGFSNAGLFAGNFLQPYTNYEIRIELSSAQANDGSITGIGGLTQQDALSNSMDHIDSDAITPGISAATSVFTGQAGTTDYSFDFGFTGCGIVTIENYYDACTEDEFSIFVGTNLYDKNNPIGIDTLLSSQGCDSIIKTNITFQVSPYCEILTEQDVICSSADLTLSAFTQFLVTPDSGLIDPTSGVGVVLTHNIIGVHDPNAVKVVITIPTWDDHFDTVKLNNQMIFPAIVPPLSINAGGMNCQAPRLPNLNGLPRSIIEITGTSVRYFSSLTVSSTSMTEVFPTNWPTTPQPFVIGDNELQFGILNTAGPTSGNWFVEAFGTKGYSYLWSTGDTTEQITVNPSVTTTYELTVTSPTGCQSTCQKTITVNTAGDIEEYTYQGCSGDGYTIEVNNTVYNEANPSDTLYLTSSAGCDSTIIVDLAFSLPVIVQAGMPTGPICSNDVIDLLSLGASITGGETTGYWSSIGNGTFDNGASFGTTSPATTYMPSQSEIASGVVILTLTSNDPSGPCEPEADAVMILINDISCSQFPWAGGF